MAAGAPGGQGSVYTLPFCLISMTFQALSAVCVLVERNRMYVREGQGSREEDQTDEGQQIQERTIRDSRHFERKTGHVEPQDLGQVSGVSTL